MARVIVLLLACVFASGCFVFDELDKSEKIMDDLSPAKPAAAPAENAPAAQGGAGWWTNAKSLSGLPAGDGESQVVACAIGKTTKFMRKGDCLSQGGHPKS
jgi:hypothetical protein